MKTIAYSTLFTGLAQSALAHSGGHMHPHGGEMTVVLGAIALIAAALVLARR